MLSNRPTRNPILTLFLVHYMGIPLVRFNCKRQPTHAPPVMLLLTLSSAVRRRSLASASASRGPDALPSAQRARPPGLRARARQAGGAASDAQLRRD